jgi:hypothetical protein
MRLARVLDQSGERVNVFACEACRLTYTSLQEVEHPEDERV